jgi:hypothetical protein
LGLACSDKICQPLGDDEAGSVAPGREHGFCANSRSGAPAPSDAFLLAQDAALAITIVGVKRELAALSNRLVQIEANKSYKSERLKLLQTAGKGVIAALPSSRRGPHSPRWRSAVRMPECSSPQTEQRLPRLSARHARAELERDLLTIEGQIAQAEISLATSQGVLAVMLETSQILASASSPPAPTGGRDL